MKRWLAMCGLIAIALGSAQAAGLSYLWDIIKKPAYKHSIDMIVAGQPVDPWVKGFLSGADGVSGPGKNVTVGHAEYELYDVCQPHNCGGNFLYVLFTPGGGQAWAVFMKDGNIVRYYGHPDFAKQKVLSDATMQ